VLVSDCKTIDIVFIMVLNYFNIDVECKTFLKMPLCKIRTFKNYNMVLLFLWIKDVSCIITRNLLNRITLSSLTEKSDEWNPFFFSSKILF